MECMRALIENDRQVDGCFTAYNSALERPVLKMDRYALAEPAASGAHGASVAVSAPPPAANPAPAVRPAPAGSPFASKLFEALQPALPLEEK